MNNTSRHIVVAVAWLVGMPLLTVPLLVSGALSSSPFHSELASVVGSLGLIGIFASWALQDAPEHGKSRNVVFIFTAAWLLLFVLAVFPYLFITRGAKGGAVAALKFMSLCLGIAIFWLGIPPLVAGIF